MERVCKKDYLIKKRKCVLAVLTCLCMMVAMLPVNVRAEENESGYAISVSPESVFFFPIVGYTEDDYAATTITVTNTGTATISSLNVTLEGTDAGKFVLSGNTITNIAVGGSANFTIRPVLGCSEGTYEAQIKIKNDDGSISKSIGVYFEVSGKPPVITQQPVGASYTKGATAAALTVVATPGEEGATLSYQWWETPYTYHSEINETKIKGATSASYTPSTAVVGTKRYYCEVSASNTVRVAKSDIVAITVSGDGETEGNSGTGGGDNTTGTSSGNNSNTSNGTSHTHSFAWRTITEPKDGQDGLEAYACTSCGYYEESVPVSAYSYACNGGAKQVISAAQGSELTLDMGVWCAYPKWFMQKIADRRDLTIRLRFEYEHKQYEVLIPAGAAVDTECDWYGPLKLCSLYSYTVK